ncbi:MAG: Gfo/Idh/MocA family oxidoreductase [Acidobacteria bacterium]|nr:Gfo/Idh/MocA family oxidoreductase [Acidobacteriota bacterium]
MSKRIGIGVIGFGWMGQAHSRGCRRAPSYFPNRDYEPDLVVVSDTVAARRDDAVRSFGFRRAVEDWREVMSDPDVDVVFITAPNMLHVEMAEAAAAAGKHVFCEKPVGGTPAQTVRAEQAARHAGVITGVGYNYRWAPLVQYARQMIADGTIGTVTNYYGRFYSMYGSDPMGLLSWRFLVDQAGHGVSTDILSHSVDLAHYLVGPITRVVGTGETFIKQRPLPSGSGTHYDRGKPGDPTGEVTNEDYAAMMCVFGNGARGTFEVCRSVVGPESQNMFEVYGTKGSIRWNFEKMNELQVYVAADHAHTGYTTVYGGDRFPHHGNFVPGSANGIGFEDLVCIEDHEFLQSVAAGRQHVPGFSEALQYVSVQQAVLDSWADGRWHDVPDMREP